MSSLLLLLALPLAPAQPPKGVPMEPVKGVPPWPSSCVPQAYSKPDATGSASSCWFDQDPTSHDQFKGPRLLQFGIPGACSGMGGCDHAGRIGPPCPPATAVVNTCDTKQMSQAYCVQLCLAWKPTFIFSSTANGIECRWCDDSTSCSCCSYSCCSF